MYQRRNKSKALILYSLVCVFLTLSYASAAPPERPLVFLPGILGSKLADENGRLLWGNRKSYSNFQHLALPRDDSDIKLKPNGVIEEIPIVWPFKVKQYRGLLETLSDLDYVEGQNFFIFAYDWRRSNYKNAALLAKLVNSEPALKNKDFDIIAHSMGGIVSVIFLHEHEEGEQVKNFITLGTPYFGSLNAFEIFLNGFSGVSEFLSELGTTEDDIRSVMFSFESGYELLPSYSLCCVLGVPNDPTGTPVQLGEVNFWFNEWLPAAFSSDEDKQFIEDGLERGKKLAQIIRRPIPQNTEHYMFAGDKFDTRAQAYFNEAGEITHFRRLGGDGTVWLQSATKENQSKARVSFNKHARIFDDKGLKTELGWILTPDGPLIDFASIVDKVEFESESGQTVAAQMVSFEVLPPLVEVGKPVTVRLELTGAEISTTNEQFAFRICSDIASPSGANTCFDLSETAGTDASKVFAGDVNVSAPGDYTIWLEQLEELEEYFAVVELE